MKVLGVIPARLQSTSPAPESPARDRGASRWWSRSSGRLPRIGALRPARGHRQRGDRRSLPRPRRARGHDRAGSSVGHRPAVGGVAGARRPTSTSTSRATTPRSPRPHRAARAPVPRRARGAGHHAQDPRHAGTRWRAHRSTRWSPTCTATRSTSRTCRSRSTATSAGASPTGSTSVSTPTAGPSLETFHSLPPSSLERAGAARAAPAAGGRHPDPRAGDPRAHDRRGYRGGPPGRRGPSVVAPR